MKAAYPLLAGIAITASAFAEEPAGQDVQPEMSDAVQKAIQEFNRRKAEGKEKANEVIVVLDPPAPPAEPETGNTPEEAEAPEPDLKSKAVLVTGKPPAVRENPVQEQPPLVLEEPEAEIPPPPADAVVELSPEPVAEPPPEPILQAPPEPALEARVESIRKGTGEIDPSQVKLKASFPAKPLSAAPQGWKLERSEQTPVFRKDVELEPGTSISLSIRPHLLAPEADGILTFSVSEPGFDAAQGYLQRDTVSSILGTSVAQLDRDSLQLGNAISELHRLLASLPKPEETVNP